MAEIIIPQEGMTDISIYPLKSNEKNEFIAIKQDNSTIYLEKSNAVALQKAINQLK